MDTLLLNTTTWDLTLDSNGNIAIAHDVYSIAQDVASAVRLFNGELWYDTTQGIPYFAPVGTQSNNNVNILGQAPPIGFLMALLAAAAESVPEVETVQVSLNYPTGSNRSLIGTITITNSSGTTAVVTGGVGTITAPPWYVQSVGGQDYGSP